MEPADAVGRGRSLLAQGADVIDIGAAASGPTAGLTDSGEELRRLEPVVAALACSPKQLSIDTSSPAVQLRAIELRVGYLNDVTGFPHPEVYDAIARSDVRLVVVHTMTGGRAVARRTTQGEALASAHRFFESRVTDLTRTGIDAERIILDPGMGLFLGDDAAPSLEILRSVGELKRAYGRPVMISVSRKSFLGELTGRAVSERGAATLAAELFAVAEGAEYIRTHDPAALRDALRVLEALEPAH
jgi:dihydropteroate synthase type 2